MEAVTNADAHPKVHIHSVHIVPSLCDAVIFRLPTGVSAGLGGNSPMSVVMEILSISHDLDFLDMCADTTQCQRNDVYMRVRTGPRRDVISDKKHDMIYFASAARVYGRVAALGELTAYSEHYTHGRENYDQSGYGLLIAAPIIEFQVLASGGVEANQNVWCTWAIKYRYRTVPFHQFTKLLQEQTSSNTPVLQPLVCA